MEFKPDENKIVLDDGKEYTYRALVLDNGLDSKSEYIEGLKEVEDQGERTQVFSHIVDDLRRINRNFHAGWQHFHGDCVVYNPAFPFKDEGLSFFTFYYDHLLRQEKLFGRAREDATVQYWTPNKQIFEYDYANEIALSEAEKRGVQVHFGQEMIKVHIDDDGQRIATFKDVDTGAIQEKICN